MSIAVHLHADLGKKAAVTWWIAIWKAATSKCPDSIPEHWDLPRCCCYNRSQRLCLSSECKHRKLEGSCQLEHHCTGTRNHHDSLGRTPSHFTFRTLHGLHATAIFWRFVGLSGPGGGRGLFKDSSREWTFAAITE